MKRFALVALLCCGTVAAQPPVPLPESPVSDFPQESGLWPRYYAAEANWQLVKKQMVVLLNQGYDCSECIGHLTNATLNLNAARTLLDIMDPEDPDDHAACEAFIAAAEHYTDLAFQALPVPGGDGDV